jgi:hypothetical protein
MFEIVLTVPECDAWRKLNGRRKNPGSSGLETVTIGLGTNPVRWQAQSSKLLNVLWIVGRFDFDWFPPEGSKGPGRIAG